MTAKQTPLETARQELLADLPFGTEAEARRLAAEQEADNDTGWIRQTQIRRKREKQLSGDRFIVVIDSREQHPYFVTDPTIETAVAGLKQGDYSVAGFETRVAIPEKEPPPKPKRRRLHPDQRLLQLDDD